MIPPETNQDRLRVLNLEDNPNDSELIQAELETEWPQVELLRVDTRDAFVRALAEFKPDLVLSDFQLPDINGRDALKIVRQTYPDIPVIMVTGALGDIEAVDLVKLGAKDYVMKDHLQRLTTAVQGTLSLEQGIRARKSMERALHESEADLKALVEHSPVAMIVDAGVGAAEKVVMMNRKFTELFGYTLEDVPDVRHWWPLAYPDKAYRETLQAEFTAQLEKTIQSHVDIKPMETSVTCKNGIIRHVRISLASIGGRNIVTFEDLTERKRAETTLRESEEKFRAIFEGALDGVLLADAENKRFATGNPAICRMLGYSPEELTRLGVADIHPQQDLPQVIEQFEAQLRGDVQLAENLPVKRKDGSVFYADIKSSAVKFGDTTYLVGVFRDITERKQAESKIRRLSQLYAALSHCNQAIVRSENEAELFMQTCKAAVEFGGFKMAWVGMLDPDTRMIKPVFSFGAGAEEYLRDIKISADATSEYGQGPTGCALRENQPVWCQDFVNSPLTTPWHKSGAALGWRSSAALPLCREGVALGAFTLYADEPDAFDEAARELLIEMSMDISYALDNFSREALRERAENETRRLTQKITLATDAAAIGIWDWNLITDQWDASPTYFTMLGYDAEAGLLDRMVWLERIHPEDHDAVAEKIKAVLAGKNTPYQYEARMRHADGSYHWVNVVGRVAERDKNGKAIRMLGVRIDITERKQAETALQNEALRRRILMEGSLDGIAIINQQHQIVEANSRFAEMLGYTREEMLDLHTWDFEAGMTEAEIRANFADFLSIRTTIETRHRRKDGTVYDVEVSIGGAMVGNEPLVFTICRDITERKHSEDSLRQLSLAVEQSPNSIVITDLDANIEYANENFVKATGYSRAEVIGKNPRILQSGKNLRATYDEMWAYLTRGEIWKGELINRRKDGSEYIEALLISPVRDADGRATHYLGIKEDITERKRIEAQLVAQYEHATGINAQLLEANKQLEQAQSQLLQSEKMSAIGLLAAGVAHEINNPIGYVNSNLGTLEKYLADIFVAMDKYEAAETLLDTDNPLVEELFQFKKKVDLKYIRDDTKALLAESHQGLDRVKKIILDLKEFSHADKEDHWVLEDVHQGLESTLNVVWNELKYKCEVVKEYATLPKIYHLPSQLNQVFMNLLVNAAQAIEVRGKITLRTGQEGDRIWIEVSDTGKGIPAANFPHLFDPFFTTKPVGKGTGLGLSVSYKIIEKHHGKIEVHSEVGKGSTFRVWLPLQQPETKEKT